MVVKLWYERTMHKHIHPLARFAGIQGLMIKLNNDIFLVTSKQLTFIRGGSGAQNGNTFCMLPMAGCPQGSSQRCKKRHGVKKETLVSGVPNFAHFPGNRFVDVLVKEGQPVGKLTPSKPGDKDV